MASTFKPAQQHAVSRSCRVSYRISQMLAIACLTAGLTACADPASDAQNLGDYLNLRNSFLNPSEVGRFDKANPWGKVRPVRWPILDQLDVIDEPTDQWATAVEPTPADLLPDKREYTVGAGDVLRVSIFGLLRPEEEYLREVTVTQAGQISVQFIGMVDVDGLAPTQIQEKIGQMAVAKLVLPPAGNGNPGPQVSVSLLQSQSRVYSVLGSVSRPGTFAVYASDMRLLTVLSQVGDLQQQPGLDFIYVIRTTQNGGELAATGPSTIPGGTEGTAPVPPATSGGNPLEAIESIEKGATPPAPSPAKEPTSAPSTLPGTTSPAGTIPAGSTGPVLLRPLPTADVASGRAAANGMLAQADLDAALSGGTTPTTSRAATMPADDLLNQAMGTPTTTKPGQYVFIDGKWVPLPGTAATAPAAIPPAPPAAAPAVPPTAAPATASVPNVAVNPAVSETNPAVAVVPGPAATTTAPSDAYANAEKLSGVRVIRIPVGPLRAGDPRYNIVIRPGDVVNVPPVEQGEFYMMGHVSRPGVFSLTGRKITLKMAVAAAGNLDGLAIPRRCDLIRRIGVNQEAVVQVNLQAIFDGEQPDIFLKPNDVVNVGTDAVAPFLAVTRNAYRLSYGFGFVYDRNYWIAPSRP